jgi:hypothetical protein
MSTAARALRSAAPPRASGHIHLPSVHVRAKGGSGIGFDYEEDVFVRGHGRNRSAKRVIRLTAIDAGETVLTRVTIDELCADELAQLDANLDFLIDEGSPELTGYMEDRARNEFARQRRIAAGREQVCASCGCSESRACSGGCVWATTSLCSRCL